VLSLFAGSHKLWLLCLPRDDIISTFRENA
jgi:hypothetical protein